MKFEPPVVTPIGNLNDLLQGGCCVNKEAAEEWATMTLARNYHLLRPRTCALIRRLVKASYMMHVYDGFAAHDLDSR